MRPNVLLVVLDTARADVFEPYGAPAGATPAVRQLAESANGMAHQRMFSTACWTLPAHASMFTGHLPRSTGLAMGTPPTFKEAMAAVTDSLPEALRAEGYDTAAISANPWISPATGFDKGFDRFEYLTTDRNTNLTSERLLDRLGWLLDALRARVDDGAAAIEHLLSEWARQPRNHPFFWFVNIMECHSPYLPPKPYSPFGPWGRIRAARDASKHYTLDALFRVAAGGWDIDDDVLVRMRAMYDASIRQLDDWLARVLQRLDDAHVLDDTLIIVTSDHGENFGEGRRLGHTYSLDNRLLHVPFVARGPVALDLAPVASLMDLPRVLGPVLGLGDRFGDGSTGVPGVAVAQLDAIGEEGDPRVHAAVERWGLGDEAKQIAWTSYTCATDGALKLVRRPDREELFDLAADPLELQPVAVDQSIEARFADRLSPLRRALDSAAARERTHVASAAGDGADADDVAALEEQMRLLGYL